MNGLNEQDCGLEGGDDDSVTVGRFNRWVSLAIRHHLLPLKHTVLKTDESLEKHIREEEIMLAKIYGGIKVIVWSVPAACFAVLYLIYAMGKAGML